MRRSSPDGVEPASPMLPVPFTAAPIGQAIPPALTTELIVQRTSGEPATTGPAPATATSPAGASTPAPPAGSTSPTEVDTLVRRLYDPIVRRLKAELQLDRERAGRSLDLRH